MWVSEGIFNAYSIFWNEKNLLECFYENKQLKQTPFKKINKALEYCFLEAILTLIAHKEN